MSNDFTEFHAAAVKLVDDMLSEWIDGAIYRDVPSGLQARINALLTSPTPTPLADAAAIAERDEPYAYEIGDPCLTQQLVYPAYLARYATDEERALPRVPLYARAASEPKALTLTDEQKNAVQHAEKILRAVKLYGLAALLADRGSEGGE